MGSRPPPATAQRARTHGTPRKSGESLNWRCDLNRLAGCRFAPGQASFAFKRGDAWLVGGRVVYLQRDRVPARLDQPGRGAAASDSGTSAPAPATQGTAIRIRDASDCAGATGPPSGRAPRMPAPCRSPRRGTHEGRGASRRRLCFVAIRCRADYQRRSPTLAVHSQAADFDLAPSVASPRPAHLRGRRFQPPLSRPRSSGRSTRQAVRR